MTDAVNSPPHYQGTNGIESIQVIEGFELTYNEGTAAAYIMRAKRKGRRVEDLKKAVWHLNREIANLEEAQAKAEAVAELSAFISGVADWIAADEKQRPRKRSRK